MSVASRDQGEADQSTQDPDDAGEQHEVRPWDGYDGVWKRDEKKINSNYITYIIIFWKLVFLSRMRLRLEPATDLPWRQLVLELKERVANF